MKQRQIMRGLLVACCATLAIGANAQSQMGTTTQQPAQSSSGLDPMGNGSLNGARSGPGANGTTDGASNGGTTNGGGMTNGRSMGNGTAGSGSTGSMGNDSTTSGSTNNGSTKGTLKSRMLNAKDKGRSQMFDDYRAARRSCANMPMPQQEQCNNVANQKFSTIDAKCQKTSGAALDDCLRGADRGQ